MTESYSDDFKFIREKLLLVIEENQMLKEKIAILEHKLRSIDGVCAGLETELSAMHPNNGQESGAV